jgi:hypothetical protein
MPGSSSLGYVSGTADAMHFESMAIHPVAALSIDTTLSTPSGQVIPRRTLTMWNAAMALFHTALATITLVLGNRDLSIPLYKTVLTFKNATELNVTDGWSVVPEYRETFGFPMTIFVATFFIISAVFHLLNATLLRDYYLRELAQCRTPTRWAEYFLSAPVMIAILAVTLGERDRSTLLALVVLVAITMPFGYWVEWMGVPRSADEWTHPLSTRLLPWVLGHVPQTTAWFLLLVLFYDGSAGAADRIPPFVYIIVWVEAVLFFSFGAASFWSQWGPPRLFYRGEQLFQILSLLSKGLLGGLLLANVLVLSEFEEIYT